MSGPTSPNESTRAQAGATAGQEPHPGAGLVKKVLTGTLLGVLVFAALSVYGDARQLAGHLARYDFSAFLAGLALATANYALRFLRWQYYLGRLAIRVPVGASLRIFVAGFVMSISPGKVGEVLKSALLAEQFDISAAKTAPIVVAERLTDLFALVLLVAIGARTFEEGTPIAIGGGVVVACLWLVCSWPWLADRLIRLSTVVPFFARIEPRLREAFDALRTVVGPGPLAFATVLATFSWFLECLCLRLIAGGSRAWTSTSTPRRSPIRPRRSSAPSPCCPEGSSSRRRA